MYCFRTCTIVALFRRHLVQFLCMLTVSLADDGDWLSVIHTSDIQSHFDESGASAKACSRSAHCFGGMPRLVTLVREERAQSGNVLVVDAGGLFNTALLNNPSAPDLLTDLVRLVGYDAMALGHPELIGDLDSLQRYMTLVGAPFVCTGGVVPPANGSAASPPCHSSLLLTVGRIKVGVVSYLSPNIAELKFYPPPKGVKSKALDEVKEETSRLRMQGARIIIALVYTNWQMVSRNMSDIAHALTDVDLVVTGNAGQLFYNGAAPHEEHVSSPYPAVWARRGRAPLLAVGSNVMLHYAGLLRLKVAPSGGCSDWRTTNPQLLNGDKDTAAEAVMARLRPSQDALLGGLVARSRYMLEGGARCRINECALGALVADAMLEASIQAEYYGNDILAWTRAGTVLFHGKAVHSSIAPGLVREEDVRMALPFNDNLMIVSVKGNRLVKMLDTIVGRNIYAGVQLSGLRLEIKTRTSGDRHYTRGIIVKSKILCTVCQMPAFKTINKHYTYRLISTENYVKTLSRAQVKLKYERLNMTLRDAARKLMRKLSPLAVPREQRITKVPPRDGMTGGARPPGSATLRVTGAILVLVLLLF